MNKIVLIKPKTSFVSTMPRIPLSLLFIGTVLKNNGYDVKIIDANVELNYKSLILQECGNAKLVGITVLTSEVKEALDISQFVKDNYSIPIVWGGIHPSLFPELTCKDLLVDYVIQGEGEQTLLELIKGNALDSIKGLVYKKDGSVILNEIRPYLNMNELPLLDYTLIDMQKYFEGGIWRKAVDVQTSRGCPYRCRFCVHSVLKTHRVRTLNAVKVVDECERLVKEYGANFITFIDDNFFLNRVRAREICQEIIRRKLNIKWFAEVRADYFRNGFIDSDFLKLAESSGLSNLTIGAESGVPYYLKLMDKGITTEQIVNSAMALSKTNIATTYSFIIGMPDETKSDIVTTLKFIEKLKNIYPNAVYNIGTLRAYPKSELTQGFVDKGIIKEARSLRDFADYNFNRVYTESPSRPIWHCDPDFAISVAKYTFVAYGAFSGIVIRNRLKFASIILFPEMLLQRLALWRLRYQFFGLQVDIVIGNLLHSIYQSKLARKVAKWRK